MKNLEAEVTKFLHQRCPPVGDKIMQKAEKEVFGDRTYYITKKQLINLIKSSYKELLENLGKEIEGMKKEYCSTACMQCWGGCEDKPCTCEDEVKYYKKALSDIQQIIKNKI